MSEVLRLKICPDSLPLVTLALGLATAEALTNLAGVAPDLRWPNDVMLKGKKCAGILVQLCEDGTHRGHRHKRESHRSFPEELADTATSLRIVTGREHNSEELLAYLVDAVDEHLRICSERPRIGIARLFPGIELRARPAGHHRPEWDGDYRGHRRPRPAGVPPVATG